MQLFLQLVISGLASGAIYASLALALVILYKSINEVNFAQGEMAMLSTCLAYFLLGFGLPYWLVFFLCLIGSFFMGVGVEILVFRQMTEAPKMIKLFLLFALLLIFKGFGTLFLGSEPHLIPGPFSNLPWIKNNFISQNELGIFVVVSILFLTIAVFFNYTRLGLAMRASALAREASVLAGIRIQYMLALGWGLAAMIGCVSGLLVAPILFLDPNMMEAVLIYAIAGALLGGINSELGAVIGGLLVGVFQNLISSYIPFIGNDLNLSVALVIIIAVSLLRPAGLLGKIKVERV
jgi:branched-chain amino acid transport system permease protein